MIEIFNIFDLADTSMEEIIPEQLRNDTSGLPDDLSSSIKKRLQQLKTEELKIPLLKSAALKSMAEFQKEFEKHFEWEEQRLESRSCDSDSEYHRKFIKDCKQRDRERWEYFEENCAEMELCLKELWEEYAEREQIGWQQADYMPADFIAWSKNIHIDNIR
jgi:hypothetical protein